MLLTFFFLLSIAVEIPIAVLFFKRKKRSEAARTCLLLNLFTWPVLHILYLSNYDFDVLKLEMGVAVIEGFGYWIMLKCGWYKGFIISIIANGLTYGLGLLIGHLL